MRTARRLDTGATREQAIGRALIGVHAFVMRGVATNRELLLATLGSEAFIAGDVHTAMLAGPGQASG